MMSGGYTLWKEYRFYTQRVALNFKEFIIRAYRLLL